jgi:hypothetical protein
MLNEALRPQGLFQNGKWVVLRTFSFIPLLLAKRMVEIMRFFIEQYLSFSRKVRKTTHLPFFNASQRTVLN